MILTIEVQADDAVETAQALQALAQEIAAREIRDGDALQRRTLRSGFYESKTPAIQSLDIY